VRWVQERFMPIAEYVTGNIFRIGEYLAKLYTSKNMVVSCTLCAWPPHTFDRIVAMNLWPHFLARSATLVVRMYVSGVF